jgi:CRP/FNR family cyclic AMP-dependent transcriptional regulator
MALNTDFGVLTGNDVETRRVRAGGIIFRQGEPGDELFVIKSGYVRIQIGNRTIAELSADDIFGEMALIDSESRSATAVAITDVEIVPVSERQFLFLVSQTPYFALRVMRTLAQRLRVMNQDQPRGDGQAAAPGRACRASTASTQPSYRSWPTRFSVRAASSLLAVRSCSARRP